MQPPTERRKAVIDALTTAAHAIAGQPEHERAGWICYLLESVEATTPEDAAPMLEALQAAIRERLSYGQW